MSHPTSGFQSDLPRRHRSGQVWLLLFQASTVIGIVALTALMLNILNSNFGYVVYVDKVDPATLAVDGVPLERLPADTLATIFREHVSQGLYTRYDREIPFADRTPNSIYELILDFVIVPEVKQAWSLWESLTRRAEIQSIAASDFPQGYLVFESWADYDFIKSPQSSFVEIAGVRTAILGSLWTIGIAILFAFPVGVGAAIYLQEYASDNWLNRVIKTNINNLAGVPSIIYGILGLAIFVRALEPLTSGALFSGAADATANGRTLLSAGLTLGLLVLPLIIINAQEAIKAVPNSLRNASYGLGATRWQTIWNHVLPGALPGILTGTILAISRAIGETAPLVVIGASTFIQADPSGPFSKFTTLPIQIFQWTSRPQDVFRNLAAAASLVLLALLLTMNATAILLRNRYGNRN